MRSMNNLEGRLVRCFSLVFPDLSEAEIPRASMASVGSWDSLATINLVTVIEEEFGIQIEADQLGEMASFDMIHDLLGSKVHAS